MYQNDHLDFCRTTSGNVVPDRCSTFPTTDIGSLRGHAAVYRRQGAGDRERPSLPVQDLRRDADRLQPGAGPRARPALAVMGLERTGRISPISAMAVLDRLEADLERARPGDFFLAHVLIPHFPYVYDADGKLRTDPGAWVENEVPNGGIRPGRIRAERTRAPTRCGAGALPRLHRPGRRA